MEEGVPVVLGLAVDASHPRSEAFNNSTPDCNSYSKPYDSKELTLVSLAR